MGHQTGQSFPNTVPWNDLVGTIADGHDAAVVAAATMNAAIGGIQLAYDDPGVIRAVFLLAKTVQAAREPDFVAALARVGIHVDRALDIYDLSAGFSDAIDAFHRRIGGRTDLGEMADLAAVKALTSVLHERAANLFGASAAEIQAAVRSLSTRAGFGRLYHEFFSEFTCRFLNYHLSRELSTHVGGNGRFADADAHSAFLDQLHSHCNETALAVRKFAGDWFAKHRDGAGITEAKAGHFTNYCLTKLRQEFELRGARDGD
jgi:hypothetical protein